MWGLQCVADSDTSNRKRNSKLSSGIPNPSVEQKNTRYAVIDIARGLALFGVVLYHLCWDLRYFGFLPVGVENTAIWLISQRILLGSFMVLTGVSLVLAHGTGIRWHSFVRRLFVLVTAAFAVSVGTYILFPEAFVYFGVLHAIALFSVLLLPFLRLPIWSGTLAAIVIVAVAIFFQSPVFNVTALSWIGFYDVPPLTNDLVPVFPWFGFALFGLVGMRILIARNLHVKLAGIQATGVVSKLLVFLGRWSLLIYLLHQPILIGVVMPAANVFQPGAAARDAEFIGSCQRSCEIGSGEVGYCQRYCGCSFEQIDTGDLWDIVTTPSPTVEQSQRVASVANLCAAIARE